MKCGLQGIQEIESSEEDEYNVHASKHTQKPKIDPRVVQLKEKIIKNSAKLRQCNARANAMWGIAKEQHHKLKEMLAKTLDLREEVDDNMYICLKLDALK